MVRVYGKYVKYKNIKRKLSIEELEDSQGIFSDNEDDNDNYKEFKHGNDLGGHLKVDEGTTVLCKNIDDQTERCAEQRKPQVSDMKSPSTTLNEDPLNGMLDFLNNEYAISPRRKKKPKLISSNNNRDSYSEINNTLSTTTTPEIDGVAFNNLQEKIDGVSTYITKIDSEFANSLIAQTSNIKETPPEDKANTFTAAVVVDDKQKKNFYGPKRSHLVKLSNDNEDSDETNSVASYDCINTDDELPSTQDFNQLINMGTDLQFNDDINFILEKQCEFHEKMISLILAIANSPYLKKYIIRYKYKDILGWCFKNKDKKFLFLQVLLAFLIGLQASPNDTFWDSAFGVEDYCYLLGNKINNIEEYFVHEKLELSKYGGLDFADLLNTLRTDETDIKYLILKVLNVTRPENIVNNLKIQNALANIFMVNSDKDKYTEMIFPLLDPKYYSLFLQYLVDNFNKYKENEQYLKLLVKVSNECNNFEIVRLTKLSLQYICEQGCNIHEDKMDLVILHLGICLNILSGTGKRIQVEDIDIKSILKLFDSQIFKQMDRQDSNFFIENLFILVFSYIVLLCEIQLEVTKIDFIKEQLRIFASTDIGMQNQSIEHHIQHILEVL
ncbi:uncharacterized protein SCODWIG_02157 [Saccharomycodes ludwigii]|uniref:Rad61 Wapl domain-containing protein n=1 Tax=Saccharomycodes ludwigii TaxID=36035 RepID=A0A376B6T0_9ASCO|nr:uncharacterized protein SCODWIG_02157 [Saccharomycodes ludwigii]